MWKKGSTASPLNPNAAEFVPSSLLRPSSNAASAAAHFVPSSSLLTPSSNASAALVVPSSSLLTPSSDASAAALFVPSSSLLTPSSDASAAAHFVPPSSSSSSSSSIDASAALFVAPSSSSNDAGKQQLADPPWDPHYLQHQLPDDITPDFNDALSLSPLSLHSNAPSSPSSSFNAPWNAPSSSSSSFNAPWNAPSSSSSSSFNAPSSPSSSSSLHFLASHFPGFAAQSLAEVYYANNCDLNLTIDMLTQLELQVDAVFDQNTTPNSNTLSPPTLTSMDFPALPLPDNKTHLPAFAPDKLQQSLTPYPSSHKDNTFLFKTGSSKGAYDFASAVRKLASQDSGLWKYDRNTSADAVVGSSKTSRVLPASYDTNAYIDRMLGRTSSRAAPVWLETGDAVANLYSELREEARDHARLRNTYFEQARQAYLSGNKALAKELSVKGQVHNMQMKAAHHKAQESIYRQRNPVSSREGSNEKMIDLHGLHVSEAIHVLRHELGILRNAARMGEQRLHVYICVGTGHHTRGSRTPARLPISVQRYLLEEGLDFTEPQPGLLRVVLY